MDASGVARRVLVTGATGFVGSRVVRQLAGAGADVAILVRPGSSCERIRDLCDRLTIIEAPLERVESWRPRVHEWAPDACIHLAWYAEPDKYLASPENIDALSASVRLVQELIVAGCSHLTIGGTCLEYRASDAPVNENAAVDPTTLYAATKLSLYLTARALAAEAHVGLAWARLFFLYGPAEDPRRLVPQAVSTLRRGAPFLSTPGAQVRDYVHVDDVAAALVTLSRGRHDGAFNVSLGAPVTIRLLLETIADELNRRDLLRIGALPYRPGDRMFIGGDNSRLLATGWTPRFDLRAGIADTCRWWMDHDSRD